MLGKLLKQELKYMGKILVPLNVLILLLTVIAVILQYSGVLSPNYFQPLQVILVFGYVLSIIAVTIASFILPFIQFYRSLFSQQGYLSFTLPVSPWSLLCAKTISGFLMYLMNFVVLAIVILSVAQSGFYPELWVQADNAFRQTLGFGLRAFIALMIVMILVSLFYSITTAYASIAIGQLYAKHKILGAILAVIGINFVVNIIWTVILVIYGLGMRNVAETNSDPASLSSIMFGTFFPINIIVQLVIAIGLYIITGIIMKKKVNLD